MSGPFDDFFEDFKEGDFTIDSEDLEMDIQESEAFDTGIQSDIFVSGEQTDIFSTK